MATRAFSANDFGLAKRLRRAPTATEALLWKQLRNRNLNGLKFRQQHPIGRYVLDFYCDEAQLAVEVDGGVHLAADVQQRDRIRSELLRERGVRFLRFSNDEVQGNLPHVLAEIAAACATTTPPLHASGEGAGGEG